jgi:hypothetical protein
MVFLGAVSLEEHHVPSRELIHPPKKIQYLSSLRQKDNLFETENAEILNYLLLTNSKFLPR